MNHKTLGKLGVPHGEPMRCAFEVTKKLAESDMTAEHMQDAIAAVAQRPADFLHDPVMADLAKSLSTNRFVPRQSPAPWKQWGADLEAQSIQQMRHACDLPVSVAGALMPDAHPGYGLPIGGVLATDNAVIPYAVGVDIACRMKMSVTDIPCTELDDDRGRRRLAKAIESETRFGVGASFKRKRHHAVLERDWSVSPVTRKNKDKAWAQLGTSGSGNHFVEFGIFAVDDDGLGISPGSYVALLSHSGSRGTGAQVANVYSKLARERHPELPKELRHLAWLDIDTHEGAEYWRAMELMGHYAAANHACIHRHIVAHLGVDVLLDIENHHNFAWKEHHLGRDVIVHRKGATPAGEGVLGIIPGSMASPAYVVSGKGQPESLNSASHGAGRVMSRRKAMQSLSWNDARRLLREKNVTLLSAGLDEVPMVYKDIDAVMASQSDLVEIRGCFRPRLVKMAPHGDRPED